MDTCQYGGQILLLKQNRRIKLKVCPILTSIFFIFLPQLKSTTFNRKEWRTSKKGWKLILWNKSNSTKISPPSWKMHWENSRIYNELWTDRNIIILCYNSLYYIYLRYANVSPLFYLMEQSDIMWQKCHRCASVFKVGRTIFIVGLLYCILRWVSTRIMLLYVFIMLMQRSKWTSLFGPG